MTALGIVNNAFGLTFNHLDQNLDRRLKTPWHTRGRLARRFIKQERSDDTQQNAPKQGVHVENRKVERAVGLLVLQMGQMVNDVFT